MRVKEIEVDGFIFEGYEGLTWHSGKFWFNDVPVKKVFNNGSVSILLYGSTKKSIKQLRKVAVKCRIKIYSEPLPF